MDEATFLPFDVWRAVGGKPGKVCRSLFGPVNRQQVQAELQSELRSGLEAARNRWAFDFEEERPVQGALQWEAVSSQDIPQFYRTSVYGVLRRRLLNPLGLRGEAVEEKVSPRQDSNPPQKRHSRKRKQTVITDFYALKRRSGPSDSESKP
ncbi:cyclin-dependent kinase inhibitor 1-like [Heterodontus francisci]|uniref:cyclin-dependent kinase inhibitor 1-like n=1 Tax=Heterodontus francisci TaxID=7792 RepID=UPI00355BEEEA